MSVFEILIEKLDSIDDPRVIGRTKHKLIDIFVIGCIAIICQAETWRDIENFGNSKIKWFRKYLDLSCGIPSHDTFARVFSLIKPEQLESVFISWINECRKQIDNDVIAFDGKTITGTVKTKLGYRRNALHLINAWSSGTGLVLGQKKASGTGNCEVTAAKELLDTLDIQGMTVVCDAGVGRRSFLEAVLSKGSNYICPIKGNPKKPMEMVLEEFKKDDDIKTDKKSEKIHENVTIHGRKERRTCTLIRRENFSKDIFFCNKDFDYYPDVQAIGRIIYEVDIKENRQFIKSKLDKNNSVTFTATKNEIRKKYFEKYFITNLTSDIKKIFESIRLQWSIENKLHWALDMSFCEDDCRTRNKIIAQNLSLIRKIALNLARHDSSYKMGIKAKLKLAGWDENYLDHLLFKTKLG